MLRDKLCYLAGLIDGEGCIMLEVRRNTFTPRLAVSQKFPGIIKWVHRTFGGSCYRNYEKWVWVLSGKCALNLLAMVSPWMLEKRVQVELLFDSVRNTTKYPHGKAISHEEAALRNGYKLALQERKRYASL